jgi:hypothetical protein
VIDGDTDCAALRCGAGNNIGSDGARAISEGCRQLTTLDISSECEESVFACFVCVCVGFVVVCVGVVVFVVVGGVGG